ncbi:hypothetical protein BFG07_17540 [Kosakonia cowanii]|nr:hypothetical protein BFG07_17540 [Kosakonia cowanii]
MRKIIFIIFVVNPLFCMRLHSLLSTRSMQGNRVNYACLIKVNEYSSHSLWCLMALPRRSTPSQPGYYPPAYTVN